MNLQEKPRGLALIVCDSVMTDSETKKKVIIGTFNMIRANEFPVQHPSFTVFVAFSEATGNYDVRLTLTSPQGEELLRMEGGITIGDPLLVTEMVFRIEGLIFSEAGRYSIDFSCNDESVFERALLVVQAE